MESVIIAFDGKTSERALPAATELAKQFLARVVVIHVTQLVRGLRGGRYPVRVDEDNQRARLQEIVAELREWVIEADIEVHTTTLASPGRIVADAASRHGAGAIVIATQRRIPLVAMFTTRVLRRLLQDAPCPVLIVTPGTTRETFFSVRLRAHVRQPQPETGSMAIRMYKGRARRIPSRPRPGASAGSASP
jgi:nucleotide-binding universal stress UspA family protein